MKKTAIVAALCLLGSCGKNSTSGSSASPNSYMSAFSAMSSATPNVSTSAKFAKKYVDHLTSESFFAGDLQIHWNKTDATFIGVDSPSSLKDYVGNLLDESIDNSIFGRAQTPFLITCCLDLLAPKTGNRFTVGSHSFTFTSAPIGVCGTLAQIGNLVGETLNIVVTNLGVTTNYDQMISMPQVGNPFGSEQFMYIRNSDSILNFAHLEDNSNEVSVSTISFDKQTESGSFQYLSKGTNQSNLYRIVMKQATDDSRVFAYKFINASSYEASFNLASTFSNHTEVAVSGSWSGTIPSYADADDFGACIATTDASVLSNMNPACSATSKTALDASGASSAITALGLLNTATVLNDASSSAFASVLPVFTTSTILSAGLGM